MNLHPLERMKGSVIKNGRLERIVYALTKTKLNSLVEEFEERNWVCFGEVYMVERYICQKMAFIRNDG
ncbi:MAG: hypothetical protein ABS938_00080 [Psychrobacillus psychrodurans]